LARAVLGDLGGSATAEAVAACFVPAVFDSAGFKKWWDAAKKRMKSDGRFRLPTKKSDPFVLLAEASSPSKGLIENFHSARFMKDQVNALDQLTKALDDFAHEVEELQSLAAAIEAEASKGRKLQAAQALELLLARDEILSRHTALKPGEGAPTVAGMLADEQSRLPALFSSLPAAKQRRALEQFPAAFGERWPDMALRLAKQAPARLVAEIARLFEKHGNPQEYGVALARWLSDRSIPTEALIWLAKERGGPYPEIFNSDLLNAIFSALERDMLDEKRGSRLQDLLLDDASLLGELLEGAAPDAIRNAMRRLMMSPVFDDLNKRSLLGRIVKMYPEMQSMIGGEEEAGAGEELLTVSWASLESRKAAYERLVNVEIPQNVKDIAMAREQGDLRENFGFKAAKEQQRVLARRRAEAERELARARGTNFDNVDTSHVAIGSVVKLHFGDGSEEQYAILGAWDSAPDLGIVSYKAGIGQALLGKRPGETAEVASDGSPRTATVVAIEAFQDLDVLRSTVHKLAPAT
jgi:transcription elongation GreA/GreB family factor